MYGEGDDAGSCTNGLTPREFRAATSEDQTIYRRWVGSLVVFYCALLLVSGAVAFAVSGGSRTEISSQANQTIASSRPN